MNASVAIQVLPSVEGEDVIRIVDEVIAYIKSSGLNTYVSPFETKSGAIATAGIACVMTSSG